MITKIFIRNTELQMKINVVFLKILTTLALYNIREEGVVGSWNRLRSKDMRKRYRIEAKHQKNTTVESSTLIKEK